MKRYFLALIWLMPVLLIPGEALLYNYLFSAYHDFFVIAVNSAYNLLFAACLAHLLHRYYDVFYKRLLLLLLLALSWSIAMVTLLVAVNLQTVFQPEMLWFSLANAKALAPVFSSAVSPFWQAYVALLTVFWWFLAVLLQWFIARDKAVKSAKKAAVAFLFSSTFLLVISGYVVGNQGAFKGQLLSFWLYSPAPIPISSTDKNFSRFDLQYLPKAVNTQALAYDTVVVLVMESARKDWLQDVSMPNLQNFAQNNLVFHNAYTTVSHSSKALYSIFCGLYPAPKMAIVEAKKGHQAYCLGHWLKDAGFATVFLQSAMANFENRGQFVKNIGFDAFIAGEQLAKIGADKLGYLAYDDAFLPKILEQKLPEYQNEKLLLSIFSSNTHHPYYSSKIACTDLPQSCYQQTAHQFDAIFKQLQNVIKQHRKPERILWVVLGDHGEAFGEKGKIWHDAVPYEEVVNIPLIMAGRTLKPGQDEQLRSIIDVPISVVDALQGSAGLKRWSMAKSLLQPKGHEHIFSYCFYPKSCRSIRTQSQKIIIDEKFGLHQQAAVGERGKVLEDQLQALQPSEQLSAIIQKSEQLKLQLQQFYSQ